MKHSHQEQVSLHGRCVPGSKLEQAAFPKQLIGRIDHLLISNHLIDLQQPLQALLQARKKTPTESHLYIIPTIVTTFEN